MEIFEDFSFENLNNSISHSVFPTSLTNAIITQVHKNGAKSFKDKCRPVSILSKMSKIYERKYQCGFRKGFNVQHCLLVLIKNENWMLIIRKYLVHFSLMFRRLLAAFYDLLIAKLYAYGFRLAALQFIKGQISKIN